MTKKSLVFFVAVILFLPLVTSAHQPRLVKNNQIKVSNPEISQAFYGELKGQPQEYSIFSAQPFRLYLGLLVPDISGAKTDISVAVLSNGQTLANLDGRNFKWMPYFEKFGGDAYLWGPEFSAADSNRTAGLKGQEMPAGNYIIKVSSPDNLGKYSLAIGDVENFPPREIINALYLVPQLKINFFAYPTLKLLSSIYIWLYLFFLYLLAFIFGLVYRYLLRKLAKVKSYKVKHNIGQSDKLIRAALAIGFLLVGIWLSFNPLLIFISGFCAFETIFSWCGFYAAIGKNSCPLN